MAEASKQQTIKGIPSLSFGTLTNFLDQFTSTDQIPTHIDKSMLPSTMSGANQAAVLSSLKFFGFTSEDNKPEQPFYDYAKATKEDRYRIWQSRIAASYGFLLDHVDIERTTSALVADRFRAQGISGDTVRKAVTFFLHAAKAGEVKVSTHVKAPRPVRSAARGKSANPKPDGDSGDSGNNGKTTPPGRIGPRGTPYEMLIDILDARMSEDEQQAVWTLIRYLKNREVKSE